MENSAVLYQNTFTPTDKDIGDYVVHKLKKRTLLSIFVSIGGMFGGLALWWLLGVLGVFPNNATHLIFAIALVIGIIFLDTFMKHADYRRLENKFRTQNSDYITGVSTQFYEDTLVANGKTYRYSDFSRVFYGEFCCFLSADDNRFIMIKDNADAFGTEDYAEFWQFLNSKCTLKAPPKPSRSPFALRSQL